MRKQGEIQRQVDFKISNEGKYKGLNESNLQVHR